MVRHGERTWELERQLGDDAKTLVFIDQVTRAPKTMTLSALQRQVLKGDLIVVSASTPVLARSDDRAPVLMTTLADLAQHHQEEINRRHRYVLYLQRAGLTRGQRSAIVKELRRLDGFLPMTDESEPVKDPHPPRASTVMEWMRRWLDSGGNIASLLSRSAVRRSPPRKDEAVRDAVRSLIRSYYLQRTRPTLIETHQLAMRKLEALAKAGAISADEATISLSTVRRLTHETSPYERDVARFGSAYAKNRWRYSLAGVDVERPQQRYEIDHTILDIVVVSDVTGMPLGRPTLTIVLDAFGHYVTGFFVSFWGTGLTTALAALKVAISPKDEYTAGQGLRNPWLPYGIPMMVALDNGLEFHSKQFHQVAKHLNMDLTFCPVRHPWMKPNVERIIGEITGQLPKEGRVSKPLDNYLPLNPDKSAAITFGAFCSGLLKLVVDQLPFQINERSLSIPFDRYSKGMDQLLPPRLPSSTRELDIIVAPSVDLTVGNEGVVTQYLRYNSRELQALRRRRGCNFKTAVKFNGMNLGSVFVRDPVTGGWLETPSCDPDYADGLSIIQHKAIRALLKGELRRREIPEQLYRTKLELIDMWNSGVVSGRRLKQETLRGLSGLTSSEALAGIGAPAAKVPSLRTESVVAAADMTIPDHEIPEFESLDLGGL